MKSAIPNPPLDAATISANVSTGFQVATKDGKPARMAIVDDDGNIVVAGPDVAWAAWCVCVEVQENFWQGQGHLVVHSSPPGETKSAKKAA
ncbi:hypothetical protein [Pseudomonas indica]|uniref:Uncharacterized protein n=1 Tax=Pseudomonas indica TaxID=137658 RepID=A0A1G8V1L3_9PSED|nr:hypothetical protein [Pseudomonas indica]SDJ59754.1 hypothetical protein SAMN05216186_10262 [Pseudomonas indica]